MDDVQLSYYARKYQHWFIISWIFCAFFFPAVEYFLTEEICRNVLGLEVKRDGYYLVLLFQRPVEVGILLAIYYFVVNILIRFNKAKGKFVLFALIIPLLVLLLWIVFILPFGEAGKMQDRIKDKSLIYHLIK